MSPFASLSNKPGSLSFASVDSPKKGTAIPAGSGFANTSAVSPFGSLAGSKSPEKTQPSTTAFGGGSVFGGFSSKSTSVFGSSAKPPSTSSPFGAMGSGGGFSSLTALSGSKPSVFSGTATPKIVGLSEKPVKAFGAAEDDDEEDEGSEDGEAGGDEDTEKAEQPPDEPKIKLPPAQVETGEENETTVYTCRAKVYAFVSENGIKEWKERGVGNLKVNIPTLDEDEDQETRRRPRILMRADGSHRLILNMPITKTTVSGPKPTGGTMMLLGVLPGETQPSALQLKVLPSHFLLQFSNAIATDCCNRLSLKFWESSGTTLPNSSSNCEGLLSHTDGTNMRSGRGYLDIN
jgi:Ran-binding protein 3